MNFIAIFAVNNKTDFFVPRDVSTLSNNLFLNNNKIKSINLNDVKNLGEYTFFNSSLEKVTVNGFLEHIGNNTFLNTKWFENNKDNEILKLGKVLLRYNRKEKNIKIPNNIKTIFTYKNIENIYIPKSLIHINNFAFKNLINLKNLIIENDNILFLENLGLNDNASILVKENSYKKYKNNFINNNIKEKIKIKSFKISFYDYNDNFLGEKEEFYGSNFENYIQPKNIKGKTFKYWQDLNGNKYYKKGYLNIYENLILKEVYEEDIYTINLVNIDNDINTIKTKLNKTIDVKKINKRGYKFLGYVKNINDNYFIIDKDGNINLDEIENNTTLYPKFKIINYNVYYETLGGILEKDLITQFNVENPLTINDLPEAKRFGYVFDRWNYGASRFIDTTNIFKDITLEAKWLGKNVIFYLNSNIDVSHIYSIVDLKYLTTNREYTFNIKPNVETVTFFGNGTSEFFKFTNLRINILPRSSELTLGFEEMSFIPSTSNNSSIDGFDAIYCPSDIDLYIMYKGNNIIQGGKGSDGLSYSRIYEKAQNNEDGLNGINAKKAGNGGNAINAYRVFIYEFDKNSSLKLIGGNGGNGGSGSDGQDGSDGVNSPSEWFFNPIKGDNGANGGDAGFSSNGGNGGYAIYVRKLTNLLMSNTADITLIGGNGGNGGQGANGGTGGNGASDTSTSIFNGVGDPGDGGNGGNGTNGGNGGNGSLATNALNVSGIGGKAGIGGNFGSGGVAGKGGHAGDIGKDGSNGKNGIDGESGLNGKSGKTAKNTIGNRFSKITKTYMFRKRV